MNYDAELYNKGNYETRRDAVYILEQFKDKIRFKSYGDRSIDIGCADGSVTNIIKSYLPANFDKFVGCDLQESMVEYATKYFGDDRITFRVVDIEGDLPKDLIEGFDHVFSFYVFHFIRKQEEAFKNIYKLLANGGDCLLTFLAHSPTYSIYQKLALAEKWKSHLSRVEEFVSPYHDVQVKGSQEPTVIVDHSPHYSFDYEEPGGTIVSVNNKIKTVVVLQDPEIIVEDLMKKIGFSYIEVKNKQMIFTFNTIEQFTDKIRGINPFAMPDDEFEEFLEDCVKTARNMNMVCTEENQIEVVNNKYNLMVVYARK